MEIALIQNRIYEIRGKNVMMDFDLAALYEVETKYLKRAVRQNRSRFPDDFMFELSQREFEVLRCNFSTSKQRGGTRYPPFAFTEQGVAMLSGILNSPRAVQTNITIMRAFVAMRHFALTYQELAQKLNELEKKYDGQFNEVFKALNLLLEKKNREVKWEEREQIGFKKYKK